MEKVNQETKEVTLYLRDYLQPGGLFPYDKLPEHLENWLAKGYEVSLISVPGFLMLSGNPKFKKSWAYMTMGKFHQFNSARDALRKM